MPMLTSDISSIVAHCLLITRSFISYLGLKALGLIFSIIQLRKAVYYFVSAAIIVSTPQQR